MVINSSVLNLTVSEFMKENVNKLFSTTTIGMEIEFNVNERHVLPSNIYNKYVINSYNENILIREYNIKPNKLRNIRNSIRKFVLLSYFLTKGNLSYDRGANDRYSGSNHLHLYIPLLHEFIRNRYYINGQRFSIFIKGIQYLYLPFFSRTSQTFRINSFGRFNLIDNTNVLNTYSSKLISITLREMFYELEFRINENFLPFYSYILTPILFLGYLYCSEDFDIERLSEYEINLIQEIIDYSQSIDEQIPLSYKEIQLLALRKIRTKKRENRENRMKFLRLHRDIFRYINTLVNYIGRTGITSKRLLRLIVNHYQHQHLYYNNISKSQLYTRNGTDVIYNENNNIFKDNPNTKLLKILLHYLIEHDKKTRELLSEREIREIINFINS